MRIGIFVVVVVAFLCRICAGFLCSICIPALCRFVFDFVGAFVEFGGAIVLVLCDQ